MARSGIVLIFYIGILCFIENVSADDLNIQSFLRSNFLIKKLTKNEAIYTEMYPKPDMKITRVLDGPAVLWEAQGDQYSEGVTIITSNCCHDVLMYIMIMDNGRHDTKYYEKTGSFFLEVDNANFNAKLSKLVNLPKFDPEYIKKIRAEVEAERKERRQKQSKLGRLKELEKEVQIIEDSDENKGEDVIPKYQQFTEFLETPEKPTEDDTNPDYTVQTISVPNDKRVIDITDPGRNERVSFDYEINDGTPTLIANVKRNKKINMIYQDKNLIWSGDSHSKLIDLTAYSDYGEFKLIQFSYSQGDESYQKYYIKNLDRWEEIGVKDFEDAFEEMKKKIIFIRNIALDVCRPNKNDFLITPENNGRLSAYTYYPNTGFHLIQVGEGENIIWSSETKRCLVATVIKEGREVKLVKLEIMNEDGVSSEKFYKKRYGDYIRIMEEEFDYLLQNPDGDYLAQFDDEPIDLTTTQEDSAESGYTPNIVSENDQQEYNPQDNNEYGDYYDNEYENQYQGQEQHQEQQNNYETQDEEYENNEPTGLLCEYTELQILYPFNCGIVDEVYRGVPFRTFTPPSGKVFNIIKIGDESIWEGFEGEYTDFIRMFYPNSQPKLGFLRLHNVNEPNPKDIYFILYEGSWAFVTQEFFLQVFEQCAGDP